ncbi:MAG: hypothetical protein QNJ51_17595 [Calothrix sp. MO_167.B12]|nr:hypothetical protein [Calothrix sp. MO_167.B12]
MSNERDRRNNQKCDRLNSKKLKRLAISFRIDSDVLQWLLTPEELTQAIAS